MFVTAETLRAWQVNLMRANETAEVLHIHDAWDLDEEAFVVMREVVDVMG